MWLETLSATLAAGAQVRLGPRKLEVEPTLQLWFLEPGSGSLRGQRRYLLKGWSP